MITIDEKVNEGKNLDLSVLAKVSMNDLTNPNSNIGKQAKQVLQSYYEVMKKEEQQQLKVDKDFYHMVVAALVAYKGLQDYNKDEIISFVQKMEI